MDTRGWRRWSWLTLVALALFVLAVEIAFRHGRSQRLIVVSGLVVNGSRIAMVLWGLGVLCVVPRIVLLLRYPKTPSYRRRWVRRFEVILIVFCLTGSGCTVSTTHALEDDYRIFSEISPRGCRVAIAHSTGMHGHGSGIIYALPDGAYQARRVSDFSSNNWALLLHAKHYRLQWDGENAELELWGKTEQDITPRLHRFTCN